MHSGVFIETPSVEDFSTIALEIKELFPEDFQWSYLAEMVQITIIQLERYFLLSPQQKKEAVLDIIAQVIDNIDSALQMITPFIDLMMLTDSEELFILQPIPGHDTEELLVSYAQELLASFTKKLEWEDIATMTTYALHFALNFGDLCSEDKKHVAKDLLDIVIDSFPREKLPPHFMDQNFKQMAYAMIDFVIEARV